MELIVSLVRHGVTEWNKVHRYQGQTDVPLSDDGRAQAEQLAARFGSQTITSWVSSDLSRAAETADIVARLHPGATIQRDAAWREMHLGQLEGKMAQDVRDSYPELMKRWQERPSGMQMPGGESFVVLQERVWTALERLREGEGTGHIAVFSHGFAIISVLCRVLGMELDSFRRLWIDPTGVSQLERRRGAWIVRSINDTGHLGPA
jgi:broad specificity phosphatase PhoE